MRDCMNATVSARPNSVTITLRASDNLPDILTRFQPNIYPITLRTLINRIATHNKAAVTAKNEVVILKLNKKPDWQVISIVRRWINKNEKRPNAIRHALLSLYILIRHIITPISTSRNMA